MRQKNDQLRSELFFTLQELLQEKTIEKISVMELCTRCDISRTTFYSYFPDIYAVLEWYWDSHIKPILAAIGESYGWNEGILRAYSELSKSGYCRGRKLSDLSITSDQIYAEKGAFDLFSLQLIKLRGSNLTEKELAELKYLGYSATFLTYKWISSGMKESPEQMAQIISRMTPSFITDAFGK